MARQKPAQHHLVRKTFELLEQDPLNRGAFVDLAMEVDREIGTLNSLLKDIRISKVARHTYQRDKEVLTKAKTKISLHLRELKTKANVAGQKVETISYHALAYAIHEHKRAAEAANLEPEPHDEALWAILPHVHHTFTTLQPSPILTLKQG